MKNVDDCVSFAEIPFCCKLKVKDEVTAIRYSGAATVGFPYGPHARAHAHTQALPLEMFPLGGHEHTVLGFYRLNTVHTVVPWWCHGGAHK